MAGWDKEGCGQGREGLDVEEREGGTGVEEVSGFGVDLVGDSEEGEIVDGA